MDKCRQTCRSTRNALKRTQRPKGEPKNWLSELRLTFHCDYDWLRLDHTAADAQSAAILSGVCSLHMANAEEHKETRHCARPASSHRSYHRTRCIPDSRQKSCDPVCNSMEVIDRHLYIFFQILAILCPGDSGFLPGIRDVDRAVEFHLVALRQVDSACGGFEVQLSELFRGQINPRHSGRYHMRL